MSSALRARIAKAYDRACTPHESGTEAPGGFLPEPGGFIPEKEATPDYVPQLTLDRLPVALGQLGIAGSVYEEVESLLHESAESFEHGTMIRREDFIQVLEIVLEGQDSPGSDLSEDYVPRSGSSESEEETGNHPIRTNTMPKSKNLHDKARFLYRLLLERIPLVPSSALPNHPKEAQQLVDVDDHQLDTRRIGLEELRYAAQVLGETPTSNELSEMLEEASTYFRSDPHQNRPKDARIGLPEYVSDLPRFTYMTYKTGMLDAL